MTGREFLSIKRVSKTTEKKIKIKAVMEIKNLVDFLFIYIIRYQTSRVS